MKKLAYLFPTLAVAILFFNSCYNNTNATSTNKEKPNCNQCHTNGNTDAFFTSVVADTATLDTTTHSPVLEDPFEIYGSKSPSSKFIPMTYAYEPVLFETNSSEIKQEYLDKLDGLADLLTHKNYLVEIRGYADSTGTKAHNHKLSIKRAAVVKSYLFQKGVSRSLLNSKGFGETNPEYTNSTAEGRTNNRRAQILLSIKKI